MSEFTDQVVDVTNFKIGQVKGKVSVFRNKEEKVNVKSQVSDAVQVSTAYVSWATNLTHIKVRSCKDRVSSFDVKSKIRPQDVDIHISKPDVRRRTARGLRRLQNKIAES